MFCHDYDQCYANLSRPKKYGFWCLVIVCVLLSFAGVTDQFLSAFTGSRRWEIVDPIVLIALGLFGLLYTKRVRVTLICVLAVLCGGFSGLIDYFSPRHPISVIIQLLAFFLSLYFLAILFQETVFVKPSDNSHER